MSFVFFVASLGRRVSLAQPTNVFLAEQAPITADDINLTESSSSRRISQTRRTSIPVIVEAVSERKPSMAELKKRRSSRVMIIGDGFDDDDYDDDHDSVSGQVMTSFAGAQGKIDMIPFLPPFSYF